MKRQTRIGKGLVLSWLVAFVSVGACAHVDLGDSPQKVAILTANGNYLTAVNGGGIGGPNTGSVSAAIHTDASTIGPWETFRCVRVAPANAFAFQTGNGTYVSAVGGGGIGGPNDNPWQIHTDVASTREPGPWELFEIVWLDPERCALKTQNGLYVTAVNNGGWGEAANEYPIHTDATKIGPWEIFTVKPVR